MLAEEPTGTVPCWTTVLAPFGPVIVQAMLLRVSPPGNVRLRPTDPTPPDGSEDVVGSGAPDRVAEEHPTCRAAKAVVPATTASTRWRTFELRSVTFICRTFIGMFRASG